MTATRVVAIVCGLASVYFLAILVPEVGASAAAMGTGDFYSVGPTALPNFAGAVTLLLSVGVFATSGPAAVDGDRRFDRGLGAGLVFTVMLVVYAIAMPSIGFLAASVLFMVAVFLVYRPASWLIALILTLAVPVLVDQVLRKLFLIPLPSGAWF